MFMKVSLPFAGQTAIHNESLCKNLPRECCKAFINLMQQNRALVCKAGGNVSQHGVKGNNTFKLFFNNRKCYAQ
jgi:hypothetical protein